MAIRLDDIEDLEGRRVSVALHDGSRIDDCQLVSGPREDLDGLWLYTEGHDTIVPLEAVTEVWEAPEP